MTVASGTAGSVVAGTIALGRVKEWSLNFTRKTSDITGMGQAADEFIPSTYTYTGNVKTSKDIADAGEVAMKAAAIGAGTTSLKLYEGTAYYNCATVIITGMGPGLTYDGSAANSYDFQGSGALA